MVSVGDDSSPPPNLVIIEDDEDDGYPMTPPVLEKQEYINEDEIKQELGEVKMEMGIDIDEGVEKTYDSAFPLPDCLRCFNGRNFMAHSKIFLFDVLCILCQRVCNETHVMKCGSYHRFCKECIMSRWESYNRRCPRCNMKTADAPEPDPTFDEIITDLRYDRNLVNYIKLDESSSSEEDSDSEFASSSEETDYDEDEEYDEDAEDEGSWYDDDDDGEEKPIVHPPLERYLNDSDPDNNWLIRRYKREHGLPVRNRPPSLTREQMVHIEIPESLDVSMDYDSTRPLENMAYKDFECNADHEWPDPSPPKPPLNLPRGFLKQVPKINKMKKYYHNHKYLTKREKKICIHYYLNNIADPAFQQKEMFDSSSDDDEPPPKFSRYRFEYPEGYRRPRKDWRQLFNDDGTRKVKLRRKKGSFDPKASAKKLKKLRWNKVWGSPLMLLRENGTSSAFPKDLFTRLYLGTGDNTTIEHLRVFLFNKIKFHQNLTDEDLYDKYDIDFYEVIKEISGEKINIIKCDENVGKMAAAARPPQPLPPPPLLLPPPPPPVMCIPSTSGAPPSLKRPPPPPMQTIHLDGKRVTFPFGTKEPTVREVALKTMCLRDDKKMAISRRMQMAPPFPDNSLRIEKLPPGTPSPPKNLVPAKPQDVRGPPTLFPVHTKPMEPRYMPMQPYRVNVIPSNVQRVPSNVPRNPSKPAEDMIQLIPHINPATNKVTYSQLTPDLKLIPFTQHVISMPPPKPQLPQPPPPQPVQGEQKGTAKGFCLKKSCTVYSTAFPLKPMANSISCGELRKKKGLKKGQRLVIFFAVKDKMPELKPIVTTYQVYRRY